MDTLIIYDDEGYVLLTQDGEFDSREPQGVPFMWVDIPDGKRIKITDGIGVDVSVTPHQVILEDIPLTEMELLKGQNTELMLAVAELRATSAQNTTETQLAIAELANLLAGGDE